MGKPCLHCVCKAITMKYLLLFLMVGSVQAQTYVITTPQGNVANYVQIQGNQAQVLNSQGNVVQNLTIYPNQAVTPQGYAIGTPSYTVPMSPPSPPSPKVFQ